MAAVIQILGPHAHCLRRYGVNPEEDVSTAVDKLNAKAPHLRRSSEKQRRSPRCSNKQFRTSPSASSRGGWDGARGFG